MHTASGFGIGFATFGKGATMNRIVLAIALCISATLGVACDTEPTPAGASADSGASNTNTDTATSTATGTGGSVSPNGGSVATGTGGAIGTGGSSATGAGGTSAPASTACPTCTNTGSSINITVNITGAGGAAATGGTTTSAGGTSAATTTAPVQLCTPGRSIDCIATTGNGRQVCSNDGMSYSTCTALASGTGGTTGTGGATATGGAVAGNGVCDAAHVRTTFNGQVCEKNTIDIYVWVPLGTGGSTGSGGKTSATGGSVSTGGTSATGGSTGTGGDINASMTCDATMPDGTKVSFAFVRNWAGRPVGNDSATTAKFCFSPAYITRTSDSQIRACPASATLRVYDEAALGSPSASLDRNLLDMPLTADGYCVSGFADGNYHVSYSYPGFPLAWAYYPVLAAYPGLPNATKQWFEKDPAVGSFGITFHVSGGIFSIGPFSGNY